MLNPDFFTDPDIVASLDAYGRLLYQGIWCVAEDSGCFEFNSLLLKMKVLPGDQNVTSENIQEYLDILIKLKKIIIYEVDGRKYGWLKNFHKHQSLNKPNPPSTPLPNWITFHGEEEFGADRHKYFYEIDFNSIGIPEDIQRNDKGKAEDIQCKENSCPEEKRSKEKRSKEKLKEEKGKSARLPPIPFQEIANLYNQNCTKMTSCIKITDSRKRHIGARWKEIQEIVSKKKGNLPRDKLRSEILRLFETVFKKAGKSQFMNGENNRNWKADLDWIIKNNSNFTKVLEGKYDSEKSKSPPIDTIKSELYDIDYLKQKGWNS